jgi:NAD-dependent deacetylase
MDNNATTLKEICTRVAACIRDAETILFITGAGISADSGLPTYRGVGGLYEDNATDDGVSIETALSGQMFRQRPDLTWKYLWQIGSACHQARPNRAHEVITLIQQQKSDTWVLTQNIDGLHREADTTNLIEMHGYAFELYCLRCGREYDFQTLFPAWEPPARFPPLCPQPDCGGVIRPNVVLFGELLPQAAQLSLQTLLSRGVDLVISVGTSSLFPYIMAPLYLPGISTVEINPAETIVSQHVTYRLPLKAAEAMERIWRALEA